MLEQGHEDVEPSQEEMNKTTCWIDLLVPYCGDYIEANAWTQDEVTKHAHFLKKRERIWE